MVNHPDLISCNESCNFAGWDCLYLLAESYGSIDSVVIKSVNEKSEDRQCQDLISDRFATFPRKTRMRKMATDGDSTGDYDEAQATNNAFDFLLVQAVLESYPEASNFSLANSRFREL
jgi:hypothetical protein